MATRLPSNWNSIRASPSRTTPWRSISSLITTHFALGGTLFNINIVDANRCWPPTRTRRSIPDLVVRVTGFTAYFASLSPEFRQLVVDRLIRGC